jgi:hypothetical protein
MNAPCQQPAGRNERSAGDVACALAVCDAAPLKRGEQARRYRLAVLARFRQKTVLSRCGASGSRRERFTGVDLAARAAAAPLALTGWGTFI